MKSLMERVGAISEPRCITFVFLRLMARLKSAQALARRSRSDCSSLSLSLCATRATSSAKRRSRIVHLRTLVLARNLAWLNNFPSERVWSRMPSSAEPKACFRRMEKKMLKMVGANTHPIYTDIYVEGLGRVAAKLDSATGSKVECLYEIKEFRRAND